MHRLLLTLCFFANAGGCWVSQMTEIGEKDVEYVDFTVNVQTHSIERTGANPSRLRAIANSRFDIFEVLDPFGRKSDEVWIRDNSVYDWNQFKLLLKTPAGNIVLHQRFQPDAPEGNPWDNLQIAETLGESGTPMESIPGDVLREQIHLIYVYQAGGLIIASYDSNGKLFRIAASHEGKESFWYANSSANNPFAAYNLPYELKVSSSDPPLNETLRNGQSKITSAQYPAHPLIRAIVAEEFSLGQIYSIAEFDSDGKEVGKHMRKFSSRPYDRHILKAHRTGR